MGVTVAPAVNSRSNAEIQWRRERTFFTAMAILAAITAFIGFYGSYYLKTFFNTPALPFYVHIHGLVFTAWILFFILQTSLVAVHRTDMHRQLGIVGTILAVFVVVMGFVTAIAALRLGRIPVGFFAVPMGSVIVFPVLVGTALVLRRKLDVHKRLMLIATAELLSAAVGRWPVVWRSSAFVNYSVTDILVLLPLATYDILTRRRPHTATLCGGLFLIGSQALRTVIGSTDAWLAFATWVKG